MLRPAKWLALLDWSDLEPHSGRRGRLHPSLPEIGHPDPESGMTTPPFWGRTVAGLAPAGALPLQAARSVAKLMITACYPQIAVFFSLKRFNLWSGSETLRQWDMNLGSQRIMKMGGVVGGHSMASVSYTHLTLPTILRV